MAHDAPHHDVITLNGAVIDDIRVPVRPVTLVLLPDGCGHPGLLEGHVPAGGWIHCGWCHTGHDIDRVVHTSLIA
jgi:hypothetical protein